MKITNFIWDFDGTLMDTFPLMLRKLCLTLEESGIHEDPAYVEELLHQAPYIACNRIGDAQGVDGAALLKSFREKNDDCVDVLPMPMPGIPELLQKLKQLGCRHYLYTHRDGTAWEHLRRAGLTELFEDGVTDSDGYAYYPVAEGLMVLIQRNGLSKEQCLMIGDSLRDRNSAQSVGIRCLLIREKPQENDECAARTLRERLLSCAGGGEPGD